MMTRWTAALAALVTTTAAALAQSAPTLRVGSSAPEVKVDKWLKGEPITEFQDGKVYVVEFWATWCGPCRTSIPHLTKLQKQYADKGVTIIGLTSAESGGSFDEMVMGVQKFMATQGDKMDYTVAIENPKTRPTAKAYMEASGQGGIPTAFIVDGQQRIAFIGHPMTPAFDQTLAQVVAGEFDMNTALKEAEAAAAAEAKIAEVRVKGDPILADVNRLMGEGDFDAALTRLDDVIRLDPEVYGEAAFRKFQFLFAHPDSAIRNQDKALAYAQTLVNELAPSNAQLHNQLAWTIATFPEAPAGSGGVAVMLAESAAKLTSWSDADVIDTLGAAYAANNNYDKAVETQMKAIEAAEGEQKAEFEQRLEQYKAKMAG